MIIMPRKKLTKKISDKLEDIAPEPKKYKIVEIKEIAEKIPQNARFGMIIAVAILWVQVIKNSFVKLFEYYGISATDFTFDILIAIIVTFIVWLVFLSWTKIARKIGKTKIKIEVKKRNNDVTITKKKSKPKKRVKK